MEKYCKLNDIKTRIIGVVTIGETLSEDMKQVQRDIAIQNGYVPYKEITRAEIIDAHKKATFFDVLHRKLVVTTDDTGKVIKVEDTIEFIPKVIKLSQTKILSNSMIASILENKEQYDALKANKDLVDWWLNSMVYVKGSVMATKIMALFGLTEESLEALVKSCAE